MEVGLYLIDSTRSQGIAGLPNAKDRRSRNLYQKLVPEKLVPVSGTYDMQSCMDFFLVPDFGIG